MTEPTESSNKRMPLEVATWWRLSALAIFILLIVLNMLWSRLNYQEPSANQLTDNEIVEDYLNAYHTAYKHKHGLGLPSAADQSPSRVPTGLFIQSLKFVSASDVSISGYIWQRYEGQSMAALLAETESGEPGFILPDRVESGNGIEPREVYRVSAGGVTIVGWYVEAILRQPFDYHRYPFDHKTVWVHLWPRSFSDDIVLTPDLDAYQSTGIEDSFGIEQDIVLGGWNRESTYFDYVLGCYDTDFGLDGSIGPGRHPELRFNVVLNRKSSNAFIVYLLPLFVVAILLFGTLLVVTSKDKLVQRHGFSTSGVLGTCAALFFVVLLAHIQLREQFAGSGTVYMEYFYFLMYIALMTAAVNTYLFTVRSGRWLWIIHYRDNLFPKLIYWPVLLLCMVMITVWMLASLGTSVTSEAADAGLCPFQVGADRGGS